MRLSALGVLADENIPPPLVATLIERRSGSVRVRLRGPAAQEK